MTSRSFYNYVGSDFSNPNNFTPTGVPQSGDTVYIVMAGAIATGALTDGLKIDVTAFPYNGRYSSLLLQNATVPTNTNIRENTSSGISSASYQSSLQFSGTVTNNGTITFGGIIQPVTLPDGASLTNTGVINIYGSSPQFTTTTTNVSFTNDGLIRVANPASESGQSAYFGVTIRGAGTITVSAHGTLELGSAVASAETVRFVGGNDAASVVQIDQASLFGATIAGFAAGDTLVLRSTTATSETYMATGPNTGTLQLYNGSATPVATLAFSGSYASGSFKLAQSGTAVQITTSVTDPSTGSTAPATAKGVFRFFDTADGTHFFTASVSERDTVLVGHPEFVEESNGFGAVLTADGTTAPVYRFFDTIHGTHFFTTSAAERDQTIGSRPDLTYEPTATFLEHAAMQPGDVAVYRLFSTADGTHLYTGNASELASLTTPGSAGYRPDLVAEGIGFYAPAGAYT